MALGHGVRHQAEDADQCEERRRAGKDQEHGGAEALGRKQLPSHLRHGQNIHANVLVEIEEDGLRPVSDRSRTRLRANHDGGPQRSVKSDIEVKPTETIDIRLPMLGDQGPFGKRAFSIRLRARQLR
jgi:hypothetical protein